MLRKRWLVLVATTGIVTAVALVLSLSQESEYEATAKVYLNRSDLAAKLNGGQGSTYGYGEFERFLETQAQFARSATVLARTVDRVGLPQTDMSALRTHSVVEASKQADLLNFSVRNGSASLAQRLADAYAAEYEAYRREVETGALGSARREVERKLETLPKNSRLYASLTEKAQQLGTLQALQTSNTALLKTAEGPVKVQPRPVQAGVLGIIFGLGLGITLAFLLDALDTRVRSTDEIGSTLGLPLLGHLPPPPRALADRGGLVMLTEPNGSGAEPYRMLKTSLDLALMSSEAQVVAISSGLAGEGKSTTVANLAVAYARSGRSVILIDLDLRLPRLDRLFGIHSTVGLTSVVAGGTDASAALYEIPLESAGSTAQEGVAGRLAVMPAGSLPPDQGDFVASPRLAALIADLRNRADLVLVDTSPMLMIGDTLSASGAFDAMVIVVNTSTARRPQLRELRRLLASMPAKKAGFVVAGSRERSLGYGYGYGYGPSGTDVGREAQGSQEVAVL